MRIDYTKTNLLKVFVVFYFLSSSALCLAHFVTINRITIILLQAAAARTNHEQKYRTKDELHNAQSVLYHPGLKTPLPLLFFAQLYETNSNLLISTQWCPVHGAITNRLVCLSFSIFPRKQINLSVASVAKRMDRLCAFLFLP